LPAAFSRAVAVIDRAIETFDVPLEQRLFHALLDAQRGEKELIEEDRRAGSSSQLKWLKRAIDDGVGTDIEQLEIDIAQELLEIEETLGMTQCDMQNLMGDQPGLGGHRKSLEPAAVIDRRPVGCNRARSISGGRS
jgi:hypothetical protein